MGHTVRRMVTMAVLATGLCPVPPVSGGWTGQFSGTTVRLTDIRMLDSTTAIAVGFGRTIIKTTDRGETWIKMLSIGANLNAVSFADPSLGIAVGDNRLVLFTTDGGESWMQRSIGGTGNFLSVAFLGQKVILVGNDGGRVLASTDTGSTWVERIIDTQPVYDLFVARGTLEVSFTAFAVTPRTVHKTTDYGESWSSNALPLTLAGIALQGTCAPGGVCYAVGYDGAALPYSRIMKRAPSDSTWTTFPFPQPSPSIVVRGVAAASPAVAYACGSAGYIWRSIDAGNSWVLVPSGSTRRLNAIAFLNPDVGFAVGDSGTVLFTADGTTAVSGGAEILPRQALLLQNYPNPFNGETVITYGVPATGPVRLAVSDLLGREVALLVDRTVPAGEHSTTWSAAGHASGTYLIRLTAGSSTATRRTILLR